MVDRCGAQRRTLTTRLAQQFTHPQQRHPELLDGTAGTALTLHTLGTNAAPRSGWDTFLLLA